MTTSNTILRRLRYTPMRDIVRLRLTGRMDLWARLDASGLPAPAAECVGRVVKHTRLWKLEKADVAQELIAHFHDGLAAGATVEELLASFGDERQAAKLIRRAKLRNRPWVWHATKRSAQAVILLVVIYTAMWTVLMTRHPHPIVDYLAKLNEAVTATPEGDRAWPIYRKVLLENPGLRSDYDALYAAPDYHLPQPGQPGWEKVEGFLRRYAPVVEAIRRGSRKPGFGLRADFAENYSQEDRAALHLGPQDADAPTLLPKLASQSLIYALIPRQGLVRLMARVAELDMELAAARHDGDRIVDDYRAILGLARQSRDQPFLINELVAISIMAMADESLMQILERSPETLNNNQLAPLIHDSAAAVPLTLMDVAGERYLMLDTIQRLYSDNGSGGGMVTYDGLQFLNSIGEVRVVTTRPVDNKFLISISLPLIYFTTASRREITEQTDRVFQLMEQDAKRPLWVVLHQPSKVDQLIGVWKSSFRDRVRYFPLLVLGSSLDGTHKQFETILALNEATQAALALELYHHEHSRYPAKLAELAPQYLSAPPIDESTGGPLRLKIVDGKPVIYGLGKDEKDDGGVRSNPKEWLPVPETGDWVLYPPPPVEPLAATPAGK